MSGRVDLWLATQNPKKAVELARLLGDRVRVRVLSELATGSKFVIDEDAPDFLGNARKKARAAAEFLNAQAPELPSPRLVLADDSGLCVDSLDGAPGVHSARYAGPGARDADRIAKLLGELAGVGPEDRTARFVCALVVVAGDGRTLLEIEESCEGTIASEPSGDQGFGYDPVFVPETEGTEPAKSFACLNPTQKDALSHRGKASRALARRIDELLEAVASED